MNEIEMKIEASAPVTYPIKIKQNLLCNPDLWLPDGWRRKKLLVITDDVVNKIYGKILLDSISVENIVLLTFPAGEKSKNQQVKYDLETQMMTHNFNRETLVLALGGGVVGDMAGFIASTYMRGVPYIQIPTTLLAMVDSSVGGKTGINTEHGKNLIGTFWQPQSVVADIICLKSLPQEHIINGLIEALKMFMTNDRDSFDYVNNNIEKILDKDISTLSEIVSLSVKIKISIVMQDAQEKNKRMILNFGHTIGHALEKISNYTLLHGYAVALGILVEAKIAKLLGFLSHTECEKIEKLFLRLGISSDQLRNYDADEIIRATRSDKKVENENVRYVLISKIGQVCDDNTLYAHPVSDSVVKQALIELTEV
ncbi:MAG: 3-dehydroquinate synthase [Gammaproteobacteria bacterium]|nr:3-dehydroquinate synthase [Gammaproteobacteria bacterium]